MYKRPEGKKSEKDHPLQVDYGLYGLLSTQNDQPWVAPHLTELHDDGCFALHQFSKALTATKEMDMSDYKPEVVTAKKKEQILQSKRALMTFLKKHIEKYKSEVAAVGNEILRVSQPDQPSDPVKAMLQEMRFREIRDNLKKIEPKHRQQAIAGSLERIQAVINNPDPNDIIINPESLTEMRREYAFTQDPSLITKEKDHQAIYKAVRDRAAEISATSAKMLIYSKVDDPLPPQEFYEVFTPQTDHEAVIVKNRILAWGREQNKLEKQQEEIKKAELAHAEIVERAARVSIRR